MKYAFFILSAFLLLSCTSAPEQEASNETPELAAPITFTVSGMTCNGCVQSVKLTFEKDPAVHSVEVDLYSETAKVTLKKGHDLDLDKLSEQLDLAGGYKASIAETNDSTDS